MWYTQHAARSCKAAITGHCQVEERALPLAELAVKPAPVRQPVCAAPEGWARASASAAWPQRQPPPGAVAGAVAADGAAAAAAAAEPQ